MATVEEFTQEQLTAPQTQVEASTYTPEQRSLVPETDTVGGQVTGLLSADSDYMKRNKAMGLAAANERGMLNTTMGQQMGQAAAIDAVLPIAQQDASINMTQGLANQDAVNKANLNTSQLESQANISNAANETALKRDSLSALSNMELRQATDTAQMERTEFSEAATTARENTKIAANNVLQNMEIASSDRANFITFYDRRGTYQLAELARLAEHPDLTAAEKASRIAEINASYEADIQLVSDLFAVPLTSAV